MFTAINRKWWVMVSIGISLAMVFIDQTAIPVALPTIKTGWHLSNIAAQWVINAYLLALAIFIVLGGKISDVVGHRLFFIIGVSIFCLGSVLSGLAINSHWLVAFRFIQGIGGACMLPCSVVIIVDTFSPEERGKAMGIFFSSTTIFLAMGPLLGGFITQYWGWRWIFWVNLPFSILCIGLLLLTGISNTKKLNSFNEIDWSGFILLATILVFFIFGVMEGEYFGWTSIPIATCFIVSFTALAYFIYIKKNKINSIIDFEFFRNPTTRSCIIALVILQVILVSTVFWSIFLQNVLDYKASDAGLMLLPAFLPMIFFGPIAGKLFDSYGPRLPATLGMSLFAVGTLWIAGSALFKNYYLLMPGLLIFGFAIPLVISSITVSMVIYADPKKRGAASGVANLARQVGGTVGLAVIGAIINSITVLFSNHFVTLNATVLSHNSYAVAFSIGMAVTAVLATVAIFFTVRLPTKD